jgi:dihydrofolate reductase
MLRKIQMPSISFIVARSVPDNVIGCENTLPWHLKTDLQNFKKVTKDKAVIMGRKTFDSIGRPLPSRKNIVLSRNCGGLPEGVECAETLEAALFIADSYSILNDKTEFFVIGGDQIYKLFSRFCEKIYLTEVFVSDVRGDAFFEHAYDLRQWKILSEDDYSKSEDDDHPFRITVLERRKKHTRMFDISEFYKNNAERLDALSEIQKINLECKLKELELEGEYEQEEFFPIPMLVSNGTK